MSAPPASSISTETAPPLRLVTGRLSCETSPRLEDVAHLRPEWDDLVESSRSPLSFTWSWCRAWWTAHATGDSEQRILVFRDGNDVVGVAPITIDRVRLGPVRLRMARVIGRDGPGPTGDLPILDGWEDAVYDELIQRLIGDERCEALSLGPQIEGGRSHEALRRACERRPDLVAPVRDNPPRDQPLCDRPLCNRPPRASCSIALPESQHCWHESLIARQQETRRPVRMLLHHERDIRIMLTTDAGEIDEELNAMVRAHGREWLRSGHGALVERPETEAFHRSLVSALAPAQRLRFLQLRTGTRVAARLGCVVQGQVACCHLIAIEPEGRRRRHEAACRLLASLAVQLIREGVRHLIVPAATGAAASELGAISRPTRQPLVVANRDAVRSRARLFGMVQDAAETLYERLWYRTVAPRLGGQSRPLALSWFRARR